MKTSFFESKKEQVRTSTNRADLKSNILKDANYWYQRLHDRFMFSNSF